jgi:DNA-binding NtrC family response regulator
MKPLVLIVDDDHCLGLLCARIIESAGYAPLVAVDARDALLLLERNPTIVLLFTDIVMPGINGFVLADMAVERWPHLRVIYTSGLTNLGDAGQQPGRHHGMLLSKPFLAEQLTSAIEMTLSRPLQSGETMWKMSSVTRGMASPALR